MPAPGVPSLLCHFGAALTSLSLSDDSAKSQRGHRKTFDLLLCFSLVSYLDFSNTLIFLSSLILKRR